MKKVKSIAKIMTFCFLLSATFFGALRGISVKAMLVGFTVTEAKFTVYPDGAVQLEGMYNNTSQFPYGGPSIQASATVVKQGDLYNASVRSAITVSPEEAAKLPFNSTEAYIKGEYSNDMANTSMGATVVLSSEGMMNGSSFDFSGFPFNSTDLTINGEYADEVLNGSMTVHMVPGLAIGDVEIRFQGNSTEITLSDSVAVFYDVSLPIPGSPRLNETYVNALIQMLNSTIPGEGPGSLYNMTNQMLKCTTLNTTLTPFQGGAEISFTVIIQGDFIGAFAKVFAEAVAQGTGGQSMSMYPMPNATLIYSALNASLHSMKGADFAVSYSSSARRLDFEANFLENLEEFRDMTSQEILSMYPAQFQPYIGSLMNTTYCSLRSYTETMSFNQELADVKGDFIFEGDMNAQVNHFKNTFLDLLNATSPSMGQEWLISTLKDTAVNLDNLQVDVHVSNQSLLCEFGGVKVAPPVEWVNSTCFKLNRFFNITSSQYGEPPRQNEQMKLTVQGEGNGTHTVGIFIDQTSPDKVPEPDEYIGKNTMVWNNQSISKLRGLLFKVFEGQAVTVYDPESVSQSTQLDLDARPTVQCRVMLTEISKPATISIRNITAPTQEAPPPKTYKAVGNYMQITADPEGAAVNATILVYYTLEQLNALGLDEKTLKIMYLDTTTNSWVPVDTQINTTERYVWTTINHLSIWAVMGQIPAALWEQPWFIPLVVIVVAVVLASIAILGLRMRKKSESTK